MSIVLSPARLACLIADPIVPPPPPPTTPDRHQQTPTPPVHHPLLHLAQTYDGSNCDAEVVIINGRGIVQYNFEATVDEELTVDRGEQVCITVSTATACIEKSVLDATGTRNI